MGWKTAGAIIEMDAVGCAQASILTLADVVSQGRKASIHELCLPRTVDAQIQNRIGHWTGRDRHLRRGESVFRQGDGPHAVYVLKRGTLKTLLVSEYVEDQILSFHFPGELIGLDALNRRAHACSAVAMEPCRVLVVPVTRLETLMNGTPPLQQAVLQLVGSALVEHQQLLAVINRRTALERVAVCLLSLCCRLGNGGLPANDFSMPVSRGDMANYLGLATETVSRCISRLHREGVLAGQGKRIHVVDLPGLMRRAVSGGDATR